MRSRRGASAMPLLRSPKSMFSYTVFHGNSANCWNTTARSGPGLVTGRPPTLTVPDVGDSSPAAMRRHVVLPQPDGPTIATNSRSRTFNEIRSSAGNDWPSRWKTRLTASNTMSLTRALPRLSGWRPSRAQHDLRRRAASQVQVAERGSALGERPLLHPVEVAERALVQRKCRGAQVCCRVRVRADQRDLGKRQLAH